MSTLTAFPYIGEQSFATPGAINSPLSIISANIAAVNAAAGSVSGVTITPPSGNTITIASDLSVLGTVAAGPARLGVSSNVTNYLFLSDTSAARSNYIIGSQIGGTADGLNLWDDSGQTMLVSFSKQSIRFFQNVVGPVFDVGGALASTLNAGTFGIGTDSKESRIQAAINAAAQQALARVYIPANMSPYSASSVSFVYTVRMVREGGDWTRFDAKAYGASGDSIADDTSALQAVAAATGQAGGIAFLPSGTYLVSHSINWQQNSLVLGDGRDVTIIKRKTSTVTTGTPALTGAIFSTGPSQTTTYVRTSRGTNLVFRDFSIDGNAAGNPGVLSNNPHSDGIACYFMSNVLVQGVTIRNCLNTGLYTFGTKRFGATNVECSNCGQLPVAGSRNGFSITGFNDTQEGVQDEHVLVACSAISNVDEGFMYGINGLISFIGCISRDNQDMGLEGDTGAFTSLTTNTPRSVVIEGCHIYNNVNYGIGIGSSNVQRYHIVGNSIESHGKAAISLTNNNATRAVIVGNSINTFGAADPTTHGITVSGGIENVVIRDNIIDGGSSVGIALISGVTQRRIVTGGNIVRNCLGGGISIAGAATGIIGDDLVEGAGLFAPGINVQTALGQGNIINLKFVGTQVRNSSRAPGIRIRTTDSGATSIVSGIYLIGVTCTDDLSQTTQTFGLQLSESSTSITGLRIIDCDFSGNASGDISGDQSWMYAVSPVESYSSISFSGFHDATRGTLSLGTVVLKAGSAINPAVAFASETSLGLFRSAGSVIQQSYGTFAVSNYSSMNAGGGAVEFTSRSGNVFSHNVTNGTYFFDLGTVQFRNGNHNGTAQGAVYVGDGSTVTVGFGFTSDLSLGFIRSAASTVKLSFGTFDVTAGVASLSSIRVKSGTNNSCGTAVLGSNGSVNVANTYVKTGDLIFLTDQTPGGTLGDLEVGGIRDSSGFTVQSTSITDTSTVGWLIIRPT